jgi:hypothetical protein
MDSINKNYVDMDEYPVTTELQVRLFLHLLFARVGTFLPIGGMGTNTQHSGSVQEY